MIGRIRRKGVRIVVPAATLVSAFLASGCVSVLPKADPAAPRYGVSVVADAGLNAGDASWSLSIDDAAASRAIDTTKIAVTRAPQQYEYYAGGEWTDRAPLLFQTALLRSFEDSGKILAVGARTAQPVAKYYLQTDIRSFEANAANGALVANVDVYARLSNRRGEIVAAQRFTATEPIQQDAAGAAARALDAAASVVVAEIIPWTLQAGARVGAIARNDDR